ncbi:hypothetical protein Moror_7576 [Moniliophthora roreri MCA 2997]|uniref:Uncharacterized protein n=1 Tax=Moniliophthora roreri (strain MCA 2997) TaxID=1381753 RepID=V2WAQ0_MONRO|nr:hypothetical protein Moror_7576 [Moniliophthora roreri MCA 2997]
MGGHTAVHAGQRGTHVVGRGKMHSALLRLRLTRSSARVSQVSFFSDSFQFGKQAKRPQKFRHNRNRPAPIIRRSKLRMKVYPEGLQFGVLCSFYSVDKHLQRGKAVGSNLPGLAFISIDSQKIDARLFHSPRTTALDAQKAYKGFQWEEYECPGRIALSLAL